MNKRNIISKNILLLFGLVFSIPHINAQEVIPDFYKQPGISETRSYLEQNINESIDPFTGSLQHHYTDLSIPGNGGFDLNVIRSYNSSTDNDYGAVAGMGWTVHFGRVLKVKETYACANNNGISTLDNPVIELPDGGRQLLYFTNNTSMPLLTAERWKATCLSNGMAVYAPDGTKYDMTHRVSIGTQVHPVTAWYTTKITDKNGNYANITYNGLSSEIKQITTNDGRSINFNYANSGVAAHRITSITGAGKSIQYNYEKATGAEVHNYFLTSVVRPDGTLWKYSYNNNLGLNQPGSFLMRQVIYPQGGYINYSYNYVYFDIQANPYSRSEVVTKKQSSTGGTWTFKYTPGKQGVYDTTEVSTPSGDVTYKHIGPNYSQSGTVWMVGLLASKTIHRLQTETYTWGKQKISNENYLRPGAFVLKVDNDSNAPILTRKQIARDGTNYTIAYSNFDDYGNPKTIAESGPNGSKTTNLTYYTNTNKWIVRNHIQNESFSGSSITRTYNNNGNITTVNDNGVTTYYNYNSQGDVSSITYPRSLTHVFSSYKRGIAQAETQPEGITISRSVDNAGNIYSETDGEGYTIKYTYDSMNRMTSATYPKGNPLKITYSAKVKTATRGNLVETVNYDSFANPISIELGGIKYAYKYDVLGRMIFASNPSSSAGTNYSYDALDRTIQISHPNSTLEKFTYGAGVTSHTSTTGLVTKYTYRSYGDPETKHLMTITTPDSTANITLTRNTKDQITSIKQGTLTRTQNYNSKGYLTSTIDPEIGTTTFGRDDAGNMTTRQIGSFNTTYTYDGQNRLSKVVYSDGTPTKNYTYNKRGETLSTISGGVIRKFNYDANTNLISEILSLDDITLKAEYGYDGNDNLSSITYPISGNKIAYTPDKLGRPTKVTGIVDTVNYHPSNHISEIKYTNGLRALYDYNIRLLPSSAALVDKNYQAAYFYYSYNYDKENNLIKINGSKYVTMTYDKLNRLTKAHSGRWASIGYAYDGVGNISSETPHFSELKKYTYSNNKLVSITDTKNNYYTYQYDNLGNISKINDQEFKYDGASNLICVDCSDTNKAILYQYDADKKRVKVTKQGKDTYELYNASGDKLVEYIPSENKLKEHIYLKGQHIAQKEITITANGGTN